MTTKTLYKYHREDGGVTISPIMPDAEYTICYRLMADEGKALTLDGVDLFNAVDTDTVEGWYEVDAEEDLDTV